jgi:SAM-dependent methyltransferase
VPYVDAVDPKPLGWGDRYAAVFSDRSVVDVYHLRPSYPEQTIDELARLAGGRAVLEAGCGLGELSRRLALRVERVDAVDVSAPMVERGRSLPGGDAPNLRWSVGRVEDAELDPPYALVVAGDSIHWLDWDRALPRFASVLGADGLLAIVHRDWLNDERVRARLRPIYERHSWNADFTPLDPATELERRGLFERQGELETSAPWRPTLDELVGVHFSTSGLARDRVRDPDGLAADLSAEIEQTLEPEDARYDLDVVARIVWGRPRR